MINLVDNENTSLDASIVSWTKYRRPEPFPGIPDHTITEVGCLTVETVHPSCQFSSLCRLTNSAL